MVGFKEKKSVSYLVFPKSLKRFEIAGSLESTGTL